MNVNIVDYLQVGHLNATTRQELCQLTGLTDRKVRDLISQAVMDGEPIASNCRKSGYYLTANSIDMIAEAVDLEAKALKLLKRARIARMTAKRLDLDQVTIDFDKGE